MTTSGSPLAVFGRMLQLVALAYIVGGILVLGMLVAPVIFHQFPIPVLLAGMMMGTIFRRFDQGLLIALSLLFIGECLQMIAPWYWKRWMNPLRLVVVLGTVGVLGYSALVVDPAVWAYQHRGIRRAIGMAGQKMDKTHKLSESLYKSGLALGTGILILLAA